MRRYRDTVHRRPAPVARGGAGRRGSARVGAQYYWIHHFHPVALLGYIAVLEGRPPSPTLVEELIERTG